MMMDFSRLPPPELAEALHFRQRQSTHAQTTNFQEIWRLRPSQNGRMNFRKYLA